MTDHPDQLLAEYVDGSLGPGERARVQAHLEACSSCRKELALAEEARDALATVPEAEPPAGLGMPAAREARRRPGRRRARAAAWALPAAAVVVVGAVLALAVVRGLGDGAPAGAPAEDAGAPADEPFEEERTDEAPLEPGLLPPGPTFRTAETDHDAASLQRLARELRADARMALDAGFAPTPADFYASFEVEALTERTRLGLECATNAFSPDPSVVPFLVERSAFEGAPAFVTAFLQAPSPQAGYDRILLIVADRATCSLQSLATQRL